MSNFARQVVQPFLNEFRKAIAEARANGATEEDIQTILAATVVEVVRQVDGPEDREWLVRQFRAAALPAETHEAPGTVQ